MDKNNLCAQRQAIYNNTPNVYVLLLEFPAQLRILYIIIFSPKSLEVIEIVRIFAAIYIYFVMRRPDIVKQIKEAIRLKEPTATAILYGSEARGDARADSDIDVLILLDGDKRNFQREEEISGALYDLELNTGVLISPMIMLRKQWENRPFKTPFYINVVNEGITL